jgi:hypothetical protein
MQLGDVANLSETLLANAERLGDALKEGEVSSVLLRSEPLQIQHMRSLHASGKLRFAGVRSCEGHAMQVTLSAEEGTNSAEQDTGIGDLSILPGDVISVSGFMERRKRLSLRASSVTVHER